jgi:hypothetical protein
MKQASRNLLPLREGRFMLYLLQGAGATKGTSVILKESLS